MEPVSPIIFQTSRLYAREFVSEDAANLLRLAGNEKDLGLMYWEPMDLDACIEFVNACLVRQLETPRVGYTLALCDKETDEFIGMVSLDLTDENRQASAGYMIAAPHRRKGYAAEALRGLLNFGFLGPELHRITASCDDKNEASIRVMESAGMRREGHFIKAVRASVFGKTGWRSTYQYAMLQKEFLMRLADGCYSPSGE